MAGLKAVFLKKLSMTAYAMGRYAITRRKTRAGAVVPKIHARRSVVALIAGAPSPYPPPHPPPSPPRGGGGGGDGETKHPEPPRLCGKKHGGLNPSRGGGGGWGR